ncbi:glycoprotein [Long Island tick rhabdovirus]|uniref:Glycoprotein n=1 Tax=Long Island tick rhabdovirus TaxID=1459044 RepID=W8R902_9RHAB|nr:glycoprotein [Long Island tick rhabdovirus]AHL66984.1 glycoprotein [Long Island tick rhabdovirus]
MLRYAFVLLMIAVAFGWEPELGEYWVPSPISPWRLATKTDFTCPSIRVDPVSPLKAINESYVEYPTMGGARKEHPGWLCIRKTYQTTCDTNFWGHQTIKHEEWSIVADVEECRQAVSHYQLGTYEDPRHPDPVCTWMAISSTYRAGTLLLPHTTLVDPFSYTFVDSLFPGTHCKTIPCMTVHPDVLWHSSSTITENCPMANGIHIKLYNDNRARKKAHEWLSVNDGPLIPLGGSCSMHYCGQAGLRTPGGIWYPYLGRQKYPECKEAWRATPTPAGNGAKLDIELQELIARRECLNVLQQIRSGVSPTFHMLSHFQPRHTGYYRVYRMNNGLVEYSLALYAPIFNITMPPSINFGVRRNKSRYHLPMIESGHPGVWSAFNGIHIMHNKTVIVPELELYKEHYSETLFYYKAQLAEHPSQVRQANSTDITPHTKTTVTVKRPTLKAWFSTMWDSLWGKVVSITGIILAIFTTGFLIKVLPWSRLFRRPQPMHPQIVHYTPATGSVSW